VTGRPTLAVAMHDGFYGAGTGAGYANHGFLHTLMGATGAARQSSGKLRSVAAGG